MILQWLGFCAITVIAYIGISVFAHLTSSVNTSVGQVFLSTLRPIPFVLLIVANIIWAIGLYYGLILTRFAIPIMIIVGALTTFVYSLFFFGAQVTMTKVAGVGLLVAGIVLLGL